MDWYHYGGTKYALIEQEPLPFFDPKEYGLLPDTEACSGCTRGYYCEFTIIDNRLLLKSLHIISKDGYLPVIAGISAKWSHGFDVYENLYIPMVWTGRVAGGSQPIREYRSYFGCAPWGYTTVRDFVFENGTLTQTTDYSTTAEEIRKLIQSDVKLPPSLLGFTSKQQDAIYQRFPVWWLSDPHREKRLQWVMDVTQLARFRNLAKTQDFNKDTALEIIQHFGVNRILNRPAKEGCTLLQIARPSNNPALVEFLLQHGADPNL